MIGKRGWVGLTGAMLLLVSCYPTGHTGPCEDGLYFSQTGHGVRGAFCAYFLARGGVEEFGYPLTDAYSEGGLVVQYFEKVRIEYHPRNRRRYRVQLGLLGETLGRYEPPIPASSGPLAFDATCRGYPQTGHTLCEPFRRYYEAHGALDRFGYPISQPYRDGGILVQDFQRGQLTLQDGVVRVADWGRVSVVR